MKGHTSVGISLYCARKSGSPVQHFSPSSCLLLAQRIRQFSVPLKYQRRICWMTLVRIILENSCAFHNRKICKKLIGIYRATERGLTVYFKTGISALLKSTAACSYGTPIYALRLLNWEKKQILEQFKLRTTRKYLKFAAHHNQLFLKRVIIQKLPNIMMQWKYHYLRANPERDARLGWNPIFLSNSKFIEIVQVL